jgi:hypothetical protein
MCLLCSVPCTMRYLPAASDVNAALELAARSFGAPVVGARGPHGPIDIRASNLYLQDLWGRYLSSPND